MVMRIEDQNMVCTEDSSSEDRFEMEKKNETIVDDDDDDDDEETPKGVWVDSIAKRRPLNRSMSVPEDCVVTGIPSITELDKLHRKRREETERKEVSEAGFFSFSVHDALLSSKVTMIEDMDTTRTSSSTTTMIGPKLRIRPQPFPSLHSLDESSTSMASPSIIPSTRDTNMLQPNPHHHPQMMIFPHSFTSPHSDRFVLHFPKDAQQQQQQQQDAYQDDHLGLDYDDDDPEVVNIANTNRNIHPQQNNINPPITSSSMCNNAIHVHNNNTTTTINTDDNKQYFHKASIIRKQPIRLKPKIASRHVPVERVPSLETKAFSSENLEQVTNDDNDVDDNDAFGENLSLPKIGNSEMRSRLDVIQPRPMRPSSEKAYHQFASNPTVNCDRTLGVVNLQDDPNGSTPVSFGPLPSRASSNPPTDDTTTATPVDKQSLFQRPLGPEQGTNEGKKLFSYLSPPNVPNHLMTSPPKMSIQNQLEMAKSAAARFSGGTNHLNGSKDRNGPATVTSPDESDPNFRTPPSKFEHTSMMGYLCPDQIVPNRRIKNASNLFLPHLNNQDETGKTTPHMTQQVTENL